ncbi:unnamed protein product [Porites lobata]|uniref:Uncharacterized protein n=1 Tax=Porites lobata TaxID=104759 RepID=A0ABN8Q347_9CNID|nr:unnamed protein product [Porites lobata]
MCVHTSNRQKLSNTRTSLHVTPKGTNSSEKTFEENVTNFKQRLRMRGYRDKVIDKHLSEVKHHERMSALQNKTKTHKKILPFVTEYRPSVPSLKKIIMHK